jgi:hypothetical protein
MISIRSLTSTLRANPYAHGVLLLLPAIQYGFNYFASVGALLFGWTLWRTRLRALALPTAAVVAAAGLSLLWCVALSPDEPNWARELRLVVGLVVLFWALAGAPRHAAERFNGRWALGLLGALVIVAAAQWVGSMRGIPLYVPKWFFVNSADWSLASSWVEHAREHGYDFSIRPSASFSEPSYLGGVSLVLHFICLHTLTGRARKVATVITFSICIVAQTYYGLLSNLLVLAVFYERRAPKLLVLSAGMLALCLCALPLFAAEPSRLERIVSGDDVSTSLRVFQPFQLLGYVLVHAPFGVPITTASSVFLHANLIAPFEDSPFQNGLLNLLISCGWCGFPILVLLWRAAGGGICAVLAFLLMGQNGAPFDFDKIVMIIFAIQIARQAQASGTLAGRGSALAPDSATPLYINEVR